MPLPYHNGQNYIQYYPNEVIKNAIFLGDANHATGIHVIKNLGITHIVNVTDCIPNAFNHVEYKHINIEDLPGVSIIDHF